MKTLSCLITYFVLVISASVNAQSESKPLSVGIFVYPGVEILDFSGPSEVFASTEGFEPFLVAFNDQPVISQGFIKVTPQYSIDNCPPTDILVFPGGGTNNVIGEQKLIQWIQDRAKTTQFMMSVCTGAALLSEAGLLEGKEATTWYGFIPELQRMTPEATILSHTRFVDNGQVVTTAGVSAGIDGALHVVSRVKGKEVAQATAKYMEYDKWHPEEGKIIESPFIATVRAKGIQTALRQHPANSNGVQPQYYRGELINLAMSMLETKPAESEAIYKWLIKNEADPALYDGLARVWKKMGKAGPVDRQTFLDKLRAGEVIWAKQAWQETRKEFPEWQLFTEEDINLAGYHLMQTGKGKEAVAVFQWNVDMNPSSANAWDSLAECYETTGDAAQAIVASERCLTLIPSSSADQGMKDYMTRLSKERMERLKEKQ